MSARRVPEPPSAVRKWCAGFAGFDVENGSARELLEGAMTALDAAKARPGRDRDGAFALLAADALLTYAAEDATRAPDPEAELQTLLRRVGEVASE